MKGIYLFLLINMVSFVAYSTTGADHHGAEHGVPRVVFYQAINVLIILIAGVYLGRQKVISFFVEKRTEFLQAQDKAQSSLRQAEQEHQEIKNRLDKLKLTKSESISKAKSDANDMKAQMIHDATNLATKIKAEAQMSTKIEAERARSQLKEQIIKEAFELSKKDLTSKATSDDQRKLQEDFISKVQVVQ